MPEAARQIVSGFLWLLQKSLEDIEPNFCERNNASDIVNVASLLVDEKRDEYGKEFPVSRELMIQLTMIFFQWLYRHRYTDHIIKLN